RKIVDIQLNIVKEMLLSKEIDIEVPEEVRDWLAEIGFDPNYGARPLKRTIQKYLINPLSQYLLASAFSKGDKINVSVGERGHLEFK
ncbi:MAG: hypothetical protein GX452_03315, partial [Ignavibacteriales bacterium]|nr:hypothetical protein [Ignavibacteriales bacterium]